MPFRVRVPFSVRVQRFYGWGQWGQHSDKDWYLQWPRIRPGTHPPHLRHQRTYLRRGYLITVAWGRELPYHPAHRPHQ